MNPTEFKEKMNFAPTVNHISCSNCEHCFDGLETTREGFWCQLHIYKFECRHPLLDEPFKLNSHKICDEFSSAGEEK